MCSSTCLSSTLPTNISNCWRHAGIPMRPDLLLHDMLTQTSCLGDQRCMLVLGLDNAFVCSHNHLRHIKNDPGNFEDCLLWCSRLMTAVIPAYAHAIQSVCLGRRAGKTSLSTILGSFPPKPVFDTCPAFSQRHAWWVVHAKMVDPVPRYGLTSFVFVLEVPRKNSVWRTSTATPMQQSSAESLEPCCRK